MVSDAVITGGMTVLGVLLGYSVAGLWNYKTTKIQISAQETQLEQQLTAQREQLETQLAAVNQRRRAEYYIEQKVEVLIQLHAIIKETRRQYKIAADMVGGQQLPEKKYDEIIEYFQAYEQAMDRANLFLEDDEQQGMLQVLDLLHDVNQHLNEATYRKPENMERYDFSRDKGFAEFNEIFNQAEGALRNEVKGPIDALE